MNTQPQIHTKETKYTWPRHGMMLLGIAIVCLGAGWFYLKGDRFVSTDNAYIKASKILLAPDVSGSIVSVTVRDNQQVKKGDVLFQIDPTLFEIALNKAQANLNSTIIQINELKAQYQQKLAELERAQVAAKYAERDLKRVKNLISRGSISVSQKDETQLKWDQAIKDEQKLKNEVGEILASLNNNSSITPQEHPLYLAAKAELTKAELDLERTTVVAPTNGIVGSAPNVGEYARASLPLINFVANDKVWIEANFKETELTNVKPGQRVTIHIDMYPGDTWFGTVESISPATGSEFSLLPAQNSTGNWVKVVQRISTHINVESGPENKPLRSGMSTEVEIDTAQLSNQDSRDS